MVSEELPTLLETDVVVVGGGPAGMCAAIAAARAGVKVAIIEQWPVLGGQSTMARVCMWHTSDRQREVIFGLTQELVQRLESYDAVQRVPDFPQSHETYVFSPEWMTLVYDDMVRELGIRTFCYTPCVAARTSGRELQGIVVATKRGLQIVRAGRFVDATGDADVGFFAGCRTLIGRESDGKVQGMTLVANFDNLDKSRREEIEAAHGPMLELMGQLRDRGELPSFGPHWFGGNFIYRWSGSLAACTSGDPLDNEDLTRMTMEARAKLPEFLRFFRENYPGCENLELAWTAAALGVRESRRVRGRHIFDAADVLERRSFPDAVGHGFWMIDIHDPDGSGYTTWYDTTTHPEPGTTYQIPYRILVADDMDNLLVAGRCASATHEGRAGLGVQSHCHVMGQAAGTAAALSLIEGVYPADIDVAALQQRLIADGVWIDEQRVRDARQAENNAEA